MKRTPYLLALGIILCSCSEPGDVVTGRARVVMKNVPAPELAPLPVFEETPAPAIAAAPAPVIAPEVTATPEPAAAPTPLYSQQQPVVTLRNWEAPGTSEAWG